MTIPTETKASEFIDRVSRLIDERNLVKEGEIVLVACSGGVDSMALLEVMDRLGSLSNFSVAAAHLDHCLRGPEGALDQAHVARFCRDRGILFMGGKEDVAKFSGDSRLSLQDAARRIRYSFLRKSLRKISGNRIATAHHADDQVETVLMRILRGTGPGGLRGIPITGDGCYIRPLLLEWKSCIRDYARTMGIPYREDPGNQEIHYHRNRIRNVLLPALEDYNPSVKKALFRLSMSIVEEGEVLDDYIDETLKYVRFTNKGNEITFDRARLLSCYPFVIKEVVKRAIMRLEAEYSPEGKNLALALDFIREAKSGKRIDLPSKFVIGRDFDEIFVTSKKGRKEGKVNESLMVDIEHDWSSIFNFGGHTWRVMVDHVAMGDITDFKGDEFQQYFDLEDLVPPLRLRRWQPGDYLDPIGMNGRKKVSDLLGEGKIPRRKRDNVLILEDARALLWIVGVRRGNKGMISRGSKRVVSITLEFCKNK
jgi:tRNA(Ile)-lysidine synthase